MESQIPIYLCLQVISEGLVDKYLNYTYPYDIDFRIKYIKEEIDARNLDGLIHYTQAFCHRAMDDINIKSEIEIPVLHIEGDKSNTLDSRTKLRIETFVDMLKDKKKLGK